jgi:hypothetical protein
MIVLIAWTRYTREGIVCSGILLEKSAVIGDEYMVKEGRMLHHYMIWECLALGLTLISLLAWSMVTERPGSKFMGSVEEIMKKE